MAATFLNDALMFAHQKLATLVRRISGEVWCIFAARRANMIEVG